MNIEHLKYVLEVDRAGSISQAADNLYMGQPNLSKAIKELENALNITIFRRTFKGAEITPKGREFLRYAKSILQQYEEIEALGREDRKDTQTLRMSVPRASYIVHVFTSFLAGLDPDKPIHMDFLETNALRAIQHVTDGISDFGVIRCKEEYQNYFTSLIANNNLKWRGLLKSRYQLLFAPGHPLSERTVIDLHDLSPYIEIIHGDTAVPHMPANVTETERGRTPGDKKVLVYERGSQFDILTRVPSAYMWVSPIPQDLLDRNQLVQRPCAESPRFSDILIYQAGHIFSGQEQTFIASLDRAAEDILSGRPF